MLVLGVSSDSRGHLNADSRREFRFMEVLECWF